MTNLPDINARIKRLTTLFDGLGREAKVMETDQLVTSDEREAYFGSGIRSSRRVRSRVLGAGKGTSSAGERPRLALAPGLGQITALPLLPPVRITSKMPGG